MFPKACKANAEHDDTHIFFQRSPIAHRSSATWSRMQISATFFCVPHTRLQTQGQQSGLLIATEAVQISLPRKTRRHCFSVDLVFLQIFRTPREAITWAANILHGRKCPLRNPQTYPPAQRAQSYSSPFPKNSPRCLEELDHTHEHSFSQASVPRGRGTYTFPPTHSTPLPRSFESGGRPHTVQNSGKS